MEWERNDPKTKKLTEEAEEEEEEILKQKKNMRGVFLCSIMVSLSGGLLLTWWLHKYHPTNSQLWMVPPGLILFITPVFISFSIFLSDFCKDNNDFDFER